MTFLLIKSVGALSRKKAFKEYLDIEVTGNLQDHINVNY